MQLPIVGAAGTASSSATGAGGASSALDARSSDPLDEVALEKDVDEEYRQRRDYDRGHQRRPVGPEAARQAEFGQSERDRPVARVLQEDDGPEEAVPAALKLKDGNGGNCWPREREHHAPE